MKSQNRWIEIQFAYLCFDLYNSLKDYMWATNYLEFLADLAQIERQAAMRLLQKVNQINAIRPTKAEFICIARQNKITIQQITSQLHISKSTYIELTHNIDMSKDYPAFSSDTEILLMSKLLNAHKTLKELGV